MFHQVATAAPINFLNIFFRLFFYIAGTQHLTPDPRTVTFVVMRYPVLRVMDLVARSANAKSIKDVPLRPSITANGRRCHLWERTLLKTASG